MATATALPPQAPPALFSAAAPSEDKYRGAVVEDLQLPPAFALPANEAISRAIELAYDRDFSYIPVLDKRRRPIGHVDVAGLKARWEAGKADPTDKVSAYMTKFNRSASEPYTLITPLAALADVEVFLQHNIFALVTDYDRKFVLGLVTMHDLETFVSRRGF
ncbi:hypothetical protein B0H10DRAFT_1981113 [Mycena sp. CBHHK59/15]|nr:hypothetical protein B0H10DRAFT_1981113 [Mycena sp. CBHHK59/15]